MIDIKTEHDKEVVYAKVEKGTHAGKVIRTYYIRPKDNVVVGRVISAETTEKSKTIAVGAGSMCEEFRKHFNIVPKGRGKRTKDESTILAKFATAIEVVQEEVPALEQERELVEVVATPAKAKRK